MTGFGRSNSLSINTSGSLFGNNTSQGQQSAGLFSSSTNASSQAAAAGGLFGSTSQPQSGGLFGGASAGAGASQPPQSASQPQSGGLFSNLNKPAATGTSTGLFGTSTTASQPQQGGGLFGGALGANAQNQNQNQTAPQSAGLFSLGQPPKPSLFGAPAQQNTSSSLFGNTVAQQNQSSTPSLFGSTQQNQPQPQNSLLGGMSSQAKPLGTLGSTGAGFSSSQQAVQIQAPESIKGTTRFNELHPTLQAEIQELDNRIQSHISNAHSVRETLPRNGESIASVAPDVAYIEQFLSTIELGIDNDSSNVAHQKSLVRKDAEDAKLSFRAIDNYRLPDQFHYGNRANLNTSTAKSAASTSLDENEDPSKPVDLVGYFSKRTEDLSSTLDLYQSQIREIEAHLRTMEAGTLEKAQQLAGSRSGARDQRRELVLALRAIEGAVTDSAKKVGQTQDMVSRSTLGSI